MARGGKRENAGRKKQQRLADSPVAARILAKVKHEELWLEIIEKARKGKTTTELASHLRYLEDRAYGRPTVPVEQTLKGTVILKTSIPRPARA